jgi:hypothetical protein
VDEGKGREGGRDRFETWSIKKRKAEQIACPAFLI